MITIDLENEDARWRWFKYEADGKSFEVELYGRTVTEALAAERRFGADGKRQRQFIAEHWFRDFRGINGPDGKPLPNTADVRLALLDHAAIFMFVNQKFADFSAWLNEGNADSGTAS